MPEIRVKVAKLNPRASLPKKAHATDVGFDLEALSVESCGENLFWVDTGIGFEPPLGVYALVYLRSSMAASGFVLGNGVGVIDPDYRGSIKLLLRYLGGRNEAKGEAERKAEKLLGQRVAQLVFRRSEEVSLEEAESLGESTRGKGGFGSTGGAAWMQKGV